MEKRNSINVSFEGMAPETADKLCKGMAEASGATLREVFGRLDEIKKMKLEDLDKLGRVLEKASNDGNGGCGIGCW
ncbi:hypothetical protein [Pseudodesulfovibrio senegalensis]|jgi:hypothetical protein|uniref:Uncharacterized protein n=1 Tax=Pseudodesulfovibrio senegalensis TaxID=1721087 RepID=A0A6N6N569_9BACT|nr:hypothetical protein [Pseudodesulfovibrio senegalensis]KAB1442928.1 hypothetical protein F8A88_01240 [Pseudodesulfovibrio senegalensis]